MRLFLAIELDDEVLHAAGRVIEALKRRASSLAPRARIGWVLPDRMHLTVRFIGYVDERQAARIRGVLKAPIEVPAFRLRVEGLGTFPPKGTPRVIWAGLSSGSEALATVEREVTARLTPVGIPPEDRPYSPHLTLARVKDAAGLKAGPLLEGIAPWSLGSATVDACTLFESRLSPKGPTYVPLQRTALAPGPKGPGLRLST